MGIDPNTSATKQAAGHGARAPAARREVLMPHGLPGGLLDDPVPARFAEPDPSHASSRPNA